jgi:hypothetical protein
LAGRNRAVTIDKTAHFDNSAVASHPPIAIALR